MRVRGEGNGEGSVKSEGEGGERVGEGVEWRHALDFEAAATLPVSNV